ncbi:hypothetical protein, partial [Lactiplantibacillus plantarum]|uniref:hypothetical protein n=1 Tax=Lactiplantibacillus plantarum TaxID=1590 RepID=UPI003F6948C5
HLLSSHSFLLHFTINQVLWGTLQQNQSSYKYLSEVAGNGKYIQVAWQKKNAEYLALYGTQSIKLPQIDNSVEFVDAEEV